MLRGVHSVLLCLSVVVFYILYIFQDTSFFHNQFQQLGSYDRQSIVMQEAFILMNYRKNTDTLVASDVYTQAEKEHLYDVKQLLYRIEYIFLLCLFLSLVFCRYLDLRVFAKTLFLLAFLSSWLFVVSWFAWDWLFDLFHRTLFVDNWLFPADSFLIQSYPWEFFRNAMMVVVFRSVVSLLIILGCMYLLKEKPRTAPSIKAMS